MSTVGGRRVRAGIVVALIGGALLVPTAGEGAFPGANGRIVYSSIAGEGGTDQIFSINPDGSGERQLTTDAVVGGSKANPAVSADGRRIAFEASTDLGTNVYVMNADGTGVTRLTANFGYTGDPTFSPDGTRIAYERDPDSQGDNTTIWTMDADGDNQQPLSIPGPNSKRDPAWSPDGSRIAFTRENLDGAQSGIATVRLDTRAVRELDGNGDLRPSHAEWLPAGDRLAYDRNTPSGVSQIFTIPALGGPPTELAGTFEVASTSPAFSPDGTRIAVERPATGRIFTMPAGGGAQTQLPTSTRARSPVWSVATAPSDPRLLARWPLDTRSAGVTPDVTPNDLDGREASAGDVAGRFGRAFDLNGARDGFTVPEPSGGGGIPKLEPAGGFSVVAWVRANVPAPVALGADQMIVAKGGRNCRPPSYALGTGPAGGLDFAVEFRGAVASTTEVVRTPPIVPQTVWDGAWHAVTGVYDQAARSVTLWVDGRPVGSAAVPAQAGAVEYFSTHITDRQLTLGRIVQDGCAQNRSFGEQVDEVRVYDIALDRRQIGYLHRADHVTPPDIRDDTSPQSTARPEISGTPVPREEVFCTTGSWTGDEGNVGYATVWDRAPRAAQTDDDPAWAPIDGAGGGQYTVQDADLGSRVRCRVTRTDGGGSTEAVSRSLRVDAGAPVNQTAPQVKLPTSIGALISGATCEPGQWTNGPDFRYQWRRDGVDIPGATRPTYTPRPSRPSAAANFFGSAGGGGDGNHFLSCVVTAANDVGATFAVSEGVLNADDVPLNVSAPSVVLPPPAAVPGREPTQVGTTASCSEGAWVDGYGRFGREPLVYRYRWLREGVPIAGAVGRDYVATVEDLGRNLRCEVTDSNLLGDSAPAASEPVLVPLPPVNDRAQIYRAGGKNQVDPTNLLALSDAYTAVVGGVVVDRLNAAVDRATEQCRRMNVTPATAPPPGRPFVGTITANLRCRMLLFDRFRVLATPTGVRYTTGFCAPIETEVAPDRPLCRNLRIQVPAIDPKRPPATDPELLGRLMPVTPQTILWDVDGDGQTDAACPGSAPVLRTILNPGTWQPRAVIVNATSATTDFFPSVQSGRFRAPGEAADGAERIRGGQVFVCATAFDPPPNPQTAPCVTSGQIGRVQVRGNLCPINARDVDDGDFRNFDGPVAELLRNQSELRLDSEGARAADAKRSMDSTEPYWVPLTEPRAGLRAIVPTEADAADAASTLNNSIASLTSFDPSRPAMEITAAQKAALDKVPTFNQARAGLALDQIYVADKDGMTVNGVRINPLGDSKALLVPSDAGAALPSIRAMTISAVNAAMRLGPPGAQGVPLTKDGIVKAVLPDAKTAATAVLGQSNFDQLAAGLQNAASALKLGPFKLAGEAKVKLNNDGTATLDTFAELPGLKALPGGAAIRADIKLTADLDGKIKLQGVRVRASRAFLGPVKLADLDLTFDNGLDIRGKILFPAPLSAGIGINRFKLGPEGQFQILDVDYLAGPGTGIKVGPGLFVTKLGGQLNLLDSIVGGRTTVSVGMSVSDKGCPTAGIDAEFKVKFAEQFFLDATGAVQLVCIPIANVRFYADQTGLVTLDAGLDLDLGPIFLNAKLGAALRLPDWQATATGKGGVRGIPFVGDLNAQIKLVLSNIGLAGCGRIKLPIVPDLAGGAAVRFADGRPPLSVVELIANLRLFTGCDISAYESVVARTAARAAQAGTQSFTIPRGAGPTVLSFEGAGAAPRVALRGPGGQTLDFADATGEQGKSTATAFGTVLESEDRTVVILGRPQAGAWTATPVAGSPPILRVRTAKVLPKPKVTARVRGKGARRVLNYDVKPLAGQTVRLAEVTRRGRRLLRTVRGGGRGELRFTVSEARSRQRRIVAEVAQDGLPRTTLTLARFTASPPSVGRPRDVRVRRRGSRAIVTWRRAPLAQIYEVAVTYGVGRRVLREPRRGARRLILTGVQRKEGLRVAVVGISPAGRRGPAGTGRLAGQMRVGSVPPRPKPKKKPAPRKRPARRAR